MEDAKLLLKIAADIDDLKANLATANKEIEKFTKQTNDNNSKTEKGWFDIKTAVSSAFGFTFASVLSNAANAISQFTTEAVQNSIKYEEQLQAIEVQSSQTADAILINMRQATRGLVDDLTLLQGTNRALSLGINEDLIPGLAQTAIALGKIQGVDTKKAFDDIVTGVGRGSPLILDNLGIILDSEKAYKEYAATIDKTADQLTKLEQKTAIATAVIENSTAVVLAMEAQQKSLNTQLQEAQTYVENFKTELGNVILLDLSNIVDPFREIPTFIREQSDEWTQNREKIQGNVDLILEFHNQLKSITQEAKDARAELSSLVSGGKTKDEQLVEQQIRELKLKQAQLKQFASVNSDGSFSITNPAGGNITDASGNITSVTGAQAAQDLYDIQKQLADLESQKNLLALEREASQGREKINLEEAGVLESSWIAQNTTDLRTKFKEEVAHYKQLTERDIPNLTEITKKQEEQLKMNLEKEKSIEESLSKQYEWRRKMLFLAANPKAGPLILGSPTQLQSTVQNQSTQQFDDFVMRPGQSPISFSPQDTLIGVKDTSSLGVAKVVNINIERVYGVDPDEMVEAIQNKLELKI